jgi:hypothetical protein
VGIEEAQGASCQFQVTFAYIVTIALLATAANSNAAATASNLNFYNDTIGTDARSGACL